MEESEFGEFAAREIAARFQKKCERIIKSAQEDQQWSSKNQGLVAAFIVRLRQLFLQAGGILDAAGKMGTPGLIISPRLGGLWIVPPDLEGDRAWSCSHAINQESGHFEKVATKGEGAIYIALNTLLREGVIIAEEAEMMPFTGTGGWYNLVFPLPREEQAAGPAE